MDLWSKLWIKCCCQYVGRDSSSNEYYLALKKNSAGRVRRYVMYQTFSGSNGSAKIPPMWHAWLHYLSDTVPSEEHEKYNHQIEGNSDVIGTASTYASINNSDNIKKLKSYSSWQPN